MSSLSRRRFLELSAAFAASAALGGCGPEVRRIQGKIVADGATLGHRLRDGKVGAPSGPARHARLVIVGAGIGGLAAAWRLRHAGLHEFEIHELAGRPGGTAAGGFEGAVPHPWGAHYLPVPRSSQRALVAFLEDCGLVRGRRSDGRCLCAPRDLARAPQERLCTAGFWREGLWPKELAGARATSALKRFETEIETWARESEPRAFRLPLASCRTDARGLDTRSALDWIRERGCDVEPLRWYLEYATRDDYGCTLEQTSLWAFLHYFCSRALPGSGASAEYLTWPEGNQRLVDLLSRELDARLVTGSMLLEARPLQDGVELTFLDARSGRASRVRAEHAILAIPQFVVARVLAGDPVPRARRSFRYAPWVVANLHLERLPASRGLERAWDNVIQGSDSLGYVDAGYQQDRSAPGTVWTWYLPVVDADERTARQSVYAAPWEKWRDLVLADLRPAHPDIGACVTRIDVRRHGHGMVKPVPGFLWGTARARAARPVGHVHFAHSDVAGLPLFEEAHWAGCRAAEAVLAARGVEFGSLL